MKRLWIFFLLPVMLLGAQPLRVDQASNTVITADSFVGGTFIGSATGLSNTVDLVAGSNITITTNTTTGRSWTIASLINTYDTIYIPAGAWERTTTNGAAWGTNAPAGADNETTGVWEFDDSTNETICASFPMPLDWNGGTVKAKFLWTGGAAGDVCWKIAGGSVAHDGALGAILGTAVGVTNTYTAATDQHITGATAAITVAGAGINERVLWKVQRDHTIDGDLTGDALLQGVWIQYQRGATNQIAW